MQTQIILLYAGQYSMRDTSTGQLVEGTSISYYFNTDLCVEDNANGTKGTRPAKCTAPFLLMGKIPKAPALYNAEMDFKVGSDGKPVLNIVDLEYLSDVKIMEVKPASAAGASSEKK